MAFFLHESLKALTIPAPNPQMEAAAFSSACCPQGPGLEENAPGQCSTGSLKLLKLSCGKVLKTSPINENLIL